LKNNHCVAQKEKETAVSDGEAAVSLIGLVLVL